MPYHQHPFTFHCRSRSGHVAYEVQDRGHTSPCWTWRRRCDPDGYGTIIRDPGHKSFFAHRVAFEAVKGPIPEGKVIDHLCRNRDCVNPDHMEPVTIAENTRRGKRARLTWADAAEIRRRLGEGELQASIAADFHISQALVSSVKSGRSWRLEAQ